LSIQARHQIRELIHNRTLKGGQVVIEQRLAEQLGVSRTPLREALQRLEGEGMVEKEAGRSYRVRNVDFEEYLHSLKVRLMIEPEAAAAAAAGRVPPYQLEFVREEINDLRKLPSEHTKAHWRSDDHVHRLIGSRCGNNVLFDTIEKLRVTTRLYEIEDARQRVDRDLEQHMALVDAVAAGDSALARKAMRTHLRSLISHALSRIS
jgi:DNA-binding GntR family transcriptional regulator